MRASENNLEMERVPIEISADFSELFPLLETLPTLSTSIFKEKSSSGLLSLFQESNQDLKDMQANLTRLFTPYNEPIEIVELHKASFDILKLKEQFKPTLGEEKYKNFSACIGKIFVILTTECELSKKLQGLKDFFIVREGFFTKTHEIGTELDEFKFCLRTLFACHFPYFPREYAARAAIRIYQLLDTPLVARTIGNPEQIKEWVFDIYGKIRTSKMLDLPEKENIDSVEESKIRFFHICEFPQKWASFQKAGLQNFFSRFEDKPIQHRLLDRLKARLILKKYPEEDIRKLGRLYSIEVTQNFKAHILEALFPTNPNRSRLKKLLQDFIQEAKIQIEEQKRNEKQDPDTEKPFYPLLMQKVINNLGALGYPPEKSEDLNILLEQCTDRNVADKILDYLQPMAEIDKKNQFEEIVDQVRKEIEIEDERNFPRSLFDSFSKTQRTQSLQRVLNRLTYYLYNFAYPLEWIKRFEELYVSAPNDLQQLFVDINAKSKEIINDFKLNQNERTQLNALIRFIYLDTHYEEHPFLRLSCSYADEAASNLFIAITLPSQENEVANKLLKEALTRYLEQLKSSNSKTRLNTWRPLLDHVQIKFIKETSSQPSQEFLDKHISWIAHALSSTNIYQDDKKPDESPSLLDENVEIIKHQFNEEKKTDKKITIEQNLGMVLKDLLKLKQSGLALLLILEFYERKREKAFTRVFSNAVNSLFNQGFYKKGDVYYLRPNLLQTIFSSDFKTFSFTLLNSSQTFEEITKTFTEQFIPNEHQIRAESGDHNNSLRFYILGPNNTALQFFALHEQPRITIELDFNNLSQTLIHFILTKILESISSMWNFQNKLSENHEPFVEAIERVRENLNPVITNQYQALSQSLNNLLFNVESRTVKPDLPISLSYLLIALQEIGGLLILNHAVDLSTWQRKIVELNKSDEIPSYNFEEVSLEASASPNSHSLSSSSPTLFAERNAYDELEDISTPSVRQSSFAENDNNSPTPSFSQTEEF